MEARGWGLLGAVDLPAWAEIAESVVLLNLVIYTQHVLSHAVPALSRVHHADVEFDVTTGRRFHPVEMVASMAIKVAAVAALGTSALAVLIFEIVLNASRCGATLTSGCPTASTASSGACS